MEKNKQISSAARPLVRLPSRLWSQLQFIQQGAGEALHRSAAAPALPFCSTGVGEIQSTTLHFSPFPIPTTELGAL